MSGVIDQDKLAAAETAFRVGFDDIFSAPPSSVAMGFTEKLAGDKLTTEIDLAADADGKPEEWLEGKIFGGYRGYAYSLPFRSWSVNKSLKRKTVEYGSEAVGRAAKRFSQWASDRFYDKLLHDALFLASGTGPLGFDGVRLFSASHPNGAAGATQSNTTSSALSASTFDAAMQAMRSFRQENGESFEVEPTHLVVGPKLWRTACEIAKSDVRLVAVDNSGAESGTRVAAAAIPNVLAGVVQVVLDRRMPLGSTQDDYWYLMDLSRESKPLVIVEHRAPVLLSKIDMNDDNRFFRDEYLWSIEADLSPGAGAWPLIYGGIL
jgi:phage major head subunit gpT-like protein